MHSSLHANNLTQLLVLQCLLPLLFQPPYTMWNDSFVLGTGKGPGWRQNIKDLLAALWGPMVQKGRRVHRQPWIQVDYDVHCHSQSANQSVKYECHKSTAGQNAVIPNSTFGWGESFSWTDNEVTALQMPEWHPCVHTCQPPREAWLYFTSSPGAGNIRYSQSLSTWEAVWAWIFLGFISPCVVFWESSELMDVRAGSTLSTAIEF